MARYNKVIYKTDYFCGIINININLKVCHDMIIILLTVQSFLLNVRYMHLLHLGLDRTEMIIPEHFYWHGIRKYVQTEVNNCHTFQSTKRSNKIW